MKLIRPHLAPLVGLLALLAITCGCSYLRLGAGNTIINMGVSVAKMLLVVCFFMELRKPGILFRLAAFAGLVWLLIYFMLILSDYSTRFPGNLLG